MAYSAASEVKYVLGMNQADVSFDTEIGKWIESADAYIDSVLKKYTTVPLGSTPPTIKWISAMFAAAAFREARDASRDAGRILRQIADGYLRTYVENTYHASTLVKSEDGATLTW